jgi:hypothetical protein
LLLPPLLLPSLLPPLLTPVLLLLLLLQPPLLPIAGLAAARSSSCKLIWGSRQQ